MAVGLTSAGFVARRQPEILEELITRLQSDSELAGMNFRAGPIAMILGIASEQIAQVWELAEEIYASQYAGASGLSLDRVAALTGTTRRPATRSEVIATVNLDGATTLSAGAIAAVLGSPDSTFRSVADVTNSGGSPADVSARFESVETGPIAAPAGALTVIPSPVTGWNSITNVADAELGEEAATDAELRLQRVVELAGAGENSVAAIRAALARVQGVEEVTVYENTTSAVDVNGLPAKSFEAVIWDGSAMAADDDEVAQAIHETAPAGIEAHGDDSGTAVDSDTAQETVVAFTRATETRVYVEATVILEAGVAAGWADEAIAAIVARGDEYGVGESVYASHLSCVLQALDFVRAVPTLTVGTSPSPVTTSVAIGAQAVAGIETADVTVGE